MRVTCDKCGGSGHVDVPDLDCEAAIVVGSEPPITCYAERSHPGEPHMAIVCAPCYACGQFEEHDLTCAVYLAEPQPTADDSAWMAWDDGDLALRRVSRPEARAWERQFRPRDLWRAS